jgi:hypothetical protein
VWTHYDKSAMIEKLNEYDWNNLNDLNFNEKSDKIIDVLETKLNELVKTVQVNLDTDYKKWYDRELSKLRSERDFAHLKFYFSDDDED